MSDQSTIEKLQQAWKRFVARLGKVHTDATVLMQTLDQEERSQKEQELLSRIHKK